jgi:putative phosphoribosyl transferase
MIALPFQNRSQAGQVLAQELAKLELPADSIVLALPRGGVPVGFEIARSLGFPLDIAVVRKIGVPWQPELAMGAVGANGVRTLDVDLIHKAGIRDEQVARIAAAEAHEAERRERIFRAGRPPLDLKNRTVILVDDGLATGSTMTAAVKLVRALEPRRVIVAVPVASPQACEQIQGIADECVCLATPSPFQAVGQWYEDFAQTSDAEVRELLSLAQ